MIVRDAQGGFPIILMAGFTSILLFKLQKHDTHDWQSHMVRCHNEHH